MGTGPNGQHQVGIGRFVATNPTDPKAREFLPLKPTATMGSDESNDFVIRDGSVSRRHAVISLAEGRLRIRDLGSTNGTFVNGIPMTDGYINDGDRLSLGTYVMTLHREKT